MAPPKDPDPAGPEAIAPEGDSPEAPLEPADLVTVIVDAQGTRWLTSEATLKEHPPVD